MGIFDKLFKTWEPIQDKAESLHAKTTEALKQYKESKQVDPPTLQTMTSQVFRENSPFRKILSVPYNSQRDNKFSPKSACNVTMIQMALANHFKITDDELFLLANSREIEDKIKFKYPKDYSGWIGPKFFRRNCANEVFVVLLEVLFHVMESQRYAKIQWNLTDQNIMDEIDKGYPFGACGNFIGGHFVLIIGYDKVKKSWIVNDPYGNWLTGYKDHNGDSLEYPMAKVKKILYTYGFKIHADRKAIV